MMLFDTASDSRLVIQPPRPDAFLSRRDEFTYSSLYGYDDGTDGDWGLGGGGGSSGSSTGAGRSASEPTPGAGAASAGSSTTTLSSSFSSAKTSSSAASFGAGGFDAAPPRPRVADEPITRDPRNGAFTFAVHAEYDLLLHVQRDVDAHRRALKNGKGEGDNKADEDFADVLLSRAILRSVDQYCLKKQWMYHVGREKGEAVARFLREGAEDFARRGGGVEGGKSRVSCERGTLPPCSKRFSEIRSPAVPLASFVARQSFTCVELGTYCGYSALVLASTLRQFVKERRQQGAIEPFEFRVYTTEISSKLLNVAQSVFRLAKVEEYVTTVLVKDDDDSNGNHEGKGNDDGKRSSLSAALASRGVTKIDFLLLDHAKARYLRDLRSLERAGMIRAGSRVSADNVVFNRLDAYRDHVRGLAEGGYATSRLEEMNLEYSNNLKDGMGEFLCRVGIDVCGVTLEMLPSVGS
ncbi:hypothetical protein ACHAWF_002261 [Thalassiosira exigua]